MVMQLSGEFSIVAKDTRFMHINLDGRYLKYAICLRSNNPTHLPVSWAIQTATNSEHTADEVWQHLLERYPQGKFIMLNLKTKDVIKRSYTP